MNSARIAAVYGVSRLERERPLPNILVPEANKSRYVEGNDHASTSAKQNTYLDRATGIRFDLVDYVVCTSSHSPGRSVVATGGIVVGGHL